MQRLNQHNFAKVKLGNTSTGVDTNGCLVTCIAMLLNTTPDVVVARLLDVGGFSGALVIWGKLEEAFPGIKVTLGWTYNNDDVRNNVPAIVRVNAAPIGGTMHFVIYEGSQKIADPWDGNEKPTGTYQVLEGYAGPIYCIIKGTWQQPATDGLPANYADIIRKSSSWDEVEKLGFSSIGALKQRLDDLGKRPESCPTTFRDQLVQIKDIVAKTGI